MGKVVFLDLLSAAYHIQREYVLEKRLVNSIKICVNVDKYFSIDVQLTRFESSLKHYIFYGDNKDESMRKWQEIMDYIATATEPVETVQERIEKIKKKK